MNVGPFELLLIAAMLGGVCALVARRKGLRPSRYFVVGMLLPILGVAIALTARPRPRL